MIRQIELTGKLVDDTSTPGDRRADQVAPAHVNGIQVSEHRFLLLISTLGFQGVDDTRSILWQLRADAYDGPVIREGVFAKSTDDWYPLGPDLRCRRQYGHPVVFGVPKGALIDGQAPQHANVFAAKWRTVCRAFSADGTHLLWNNEPKAVRERTQGVEWCQFRLNAAEDDLELLQPAMSLRQGGYESGAAFTIYGDCPMNQSYVQPVAYNDDRTEWVDMATFNLQSEGSRNGSAAVAHVAACLYRFDPDTSLYRFERVGPRLGPDLFEGCILPWRGDWVIAARRASDAGGVAWTRTPDPFARAPPVTIPDDVRSARTPLSAYLCPDGRVRLLSGDGVLSPYDWNRNPLYMWDIDPDNGFRAGPASCVFDSYQAGVPIDPELHPIVDMAKLLPHAGGDTQVLIHRVRSVAMFVVEADYGGPMRQMNEGSFTGTAVYSERVKYEESYPGCWAFA